MSSSERDETRPLLEDEQRLAPRARRKFVKHMTDFLMGRFTNPTVPKDVKLVCDEVDLQDIEKQFSIGEIQYLMRSMCNVKPAVGDVAQFPAFMLFLNIPAITAKNNGKYVYEKILTAFAEDAQEYFKKFYFKAVNCVTPEVFFFAFNRTVTSLKWYNWIKRRTLFSPKNSFAHCALKMITDGLESPNPAHKTAALAQLKKLPAELIAGMLKKGDDVPAILSVETLETLIRILVDKINTSWFKGKYEDMMEVCLHKLMDFSNPKDGLKIDRALLKQCVTIINNYRLAKNRKRILDYKDEEGYTLFAYIRRILPSFSEHDYPNLGTDYTHPITLETAFMWWMSAQQSKAMRSSWLGALVSNPNESKDSFADHTKVGGLFISPQNMLLQIAEVPDEFATYKDCAASLVKDYGADIYFSDGDRLSFLEVALMKQGAMWEFCLEKRGTDEKLLLKVIDIVARISLNVDITESKQALLNKCLVAIKQLVTRGWNPVKVTQAMRDKVAGCENSANPTLSEIFSLLNANNNSSNNSRVVNDNNRGSAAPAAVPSAVAPAARPDMERVAALQKLRAILSDNAKGDVNEMEACLKKLMALSGFAGPALDPELAKECLRIINNYKLHSNRQKFFGHEHELRAQGFIRMLAYVRRSVPRFDDYPQLQEFIRANDTLAKQFEIYSSRDRFDSTWNVQFKEHILLGWLSPQDMLLEIARVPSEFSQYKKFAEEMASGEYGADLDFSDGKRQSFFDVALMELGKEPSQVDMWELCKLKCDTYEKLVFKLLDIVAAIALDLNKGVPLTESQRDTLSGCCTAIEELVAGKWKFAGVTQAMRDKVRDYKNAVNPMLNQVFILLNNRGGVNNNNNNVNAYNSPVAVPSAVAPAARPDMERVTTFDPFAFATTTAETPSVARDEKSSAVPQSKPFTLDDVLTWDKERLKREVEAGTVNPQHLLVQNPQGASLYHFTENFRNLLERLVDDYHADLDAGDWSFLCTALDRQTEGKPETFARWNFYLSKRPNHEAVLLNVLDVFVRRQPGAVFWNASKMIHWLVEREVNPVKVTPEMVDKVKQFENSDNRHQKEIFNLLSGKLAEQQAVKPVSSFDPFALVGKDINFEKLIRLLQKAIEKNDFTADINCYVETVEDKVKALPGNLKKALCRHTLSNTSKEILERNDFKKEGYLTLGNEAFGIAARVNHARETSARIIERFNRLGSHGTDLVPIHLLRAAQDVPESKENQNNINDMNDDNYSAGMRSGAVAAQVMAKRDEQKRRRDSFGVEWSVEPVTIAGSDTPINRK